jgi:hypothetical protein
MDICGGTIGTNVGSNPNANAFRCGTTIYRNQELDMYAFTSAGNLNMTASTNNPGTDFATSLIVLTSDGASSPYCGACVGGDENSSQRDTSTVYFSVTPGETYYVLVTGSSPFGTDYSGIYELTVTDAVPTPSAVPSAEGTVSPVATSAVPSVSSAPSSSPSEFCRPKSKPIPDRAALDDAINDFLVNGPSAPYGDINTWDIRHITDLSDLFYYKGTFNSDISCWYVYRPLHTPPLHAPPLTFPLATAQGYVTCDEHGQYVRRCRRL